MGYVHVWVYWHNIIIRIISYNFKINCGTVLSIMLGFNMLFKVTNVKMEHNENVANGPFRSDVTTRVK